MTIIIVIVNFQNTDLNAAIIGDYWYVSVTGIGIGM